MEDLLGAMFGGMGPGGMGGMGGMPGMGGGGRGGRRRRGEDIGIRHPVTLEELFSGAEVTVPRDRTVICDQCAGSGAKRSGSTTACRTCRGQGQVMQMREVGPGFVTRAVGNCPECNGQGSTVAVQDRCVKCSGKRMVQENAPLQVTVKPGMRHGEQIPFMGAGDEDMNCAEPGDVVVVLQMKDHPTFSREGDDLRMKVKISLAESLCAAQITVRHLDGRTIHVKPSPGRIIEPESCWKVRGEGMPVLNRAGHRNQATGRRGDLFLDFDVEFPRQLTEDSVALLKAALPPAPAKPIINEEDEHVEECYGAPQPLKDVRAMIQKEASSDDDDDGPGGRGGPGGPGVQCAHA